MYVLTELLTAIYNIFFDGSEETQYRLNEHKIPTIKFEEQTLLFHKLDNN